MLGSVEAIQGSVVDVRFAVGEEPMLREVLHVLRDNGAPLVMEVHAHPEPGLARALALEPTAGLFRGQAVEAGGHPLRMPVGLGLLGRVVDGLGRPLDGGPPVACTESRSVHRAPPPLHRYLAETEVMHTGIKVIDLLCPLPAVGRRACSGERGSERRCC